MLIWHILCGLTPLGIGARLSSVSLLTTLPTLALNTLRFGLSLALVYLCMPNFKGLLVLLIPLPENTASAHP